MLKFYPWGWDIWTPFGRVGIATVDGYKYLFLENFEKYLSWKILWTNKHA